METTMFNWHPIDNVGVVTLASRPKTNQAPSKSKNAC